MSHLKADFAASAPPSSHGPAGPTFRPSKPSSSHGSTTRAGRRAMQQQQQHRVPPLKGGAAVKAAPPRASLISQQQRDALQVSAFGFSTNRGSPAADGNAASGTPPQQTYTDTLTSSPGESSGRGKRTNAATVAAIAASQARSRHTACPNDAAIVVMQPEKVSARFHLCVQALAEGCVQSYMHLFHLSHRDPVCVDVLSQSYFVVPEDRLQWAQEQLSAIEVLRRQSEFPEVMARCQSLADYFEKEKDLEEAAWHYDNALRCASESLETRLELDARAAYAQFLERHDKLAAAVDMYESMRSLAVAAKDAAQAHEACAALVRVYRALGDQLASQDQLDADADLVKRCYEMSVRYAQRTSASAHEGEGYDALGKILERGGQLGKALQYQQSYRDVSRRHQLRSHECRATLNVAGLEEQLGRTAEATASLHDALALAKDLGDAERVCRATMQLGEVYRAEGDAQAAMTCFREAFPAAFASGKPDLIDSVRVAMGFAAGEFYFANAGGGKGYLPIVCQDVRAQLAWMSNGEL